MISISLNLRTIIIALLVLSVIIYLIKSEEKPQEVISTEETHQPQIQEEVSSFWTKILLIENENTKLYQYQLPNEFNVNPRYLMFHPNFTLSANKTVQIVSEHEGEAVAMLNLWVSLNKGLLDGEENFSKLFETSIKRALTFPQVIHKFKIDINNMVHFNNQPEEKPENLEYAEDLALNEVQLEDKPNEEVIQQKENEEKFEPLNSFNESMASF